MNHENLESNFLYARERFCPDISKGIRDLRTISFGSIWTVEIQSKPGRSGRPSSTMVFIWTRMDGSCALFSIWPRPDGPEGPECDKMHTRISLSGRMYAFTNVYRLIMSMMIISSLICPTAIQSEIIFTTPQKYFKFFVTSIFEILEILRYFQRKS